MFLLFMLLAWMTGSCVLVDEDLSDVGEPTLTLAMSVKKSSSEHTVTTKMPSATTQTNGKFRGIDQLYIIPFRTGSDSESDAVTGNDSRLGSENITMANPGIASSGLINNSFRLFDLAHIPLGTNRVLVYGEAQQDKVSVASKTLKHRYGVLTAEDLYNFPKAKDIHFQLEPILGTRSDGEETVNEYAEASALADDILSKLNEVMRQILLSESSAIKTIYDLISVYSEDKILACSYHVFNWISSQIFTALTEDGMYNSSTIYDIIRVTGYVSEFVDAIEAAGSDFPTRYGIPEGTMGFWWNGNKFVRLINGVNIALVDPENYCYPPSLWYCANSPVQTSKDGGVKAQYIPDNDWETILGYYNDGPVVTSFIKSVAVTESLQYGPGLLDLSFLKPGKEAEVASGCTLTGIIIGDQKNVGFDFAPYAHTEKNPNPSRYIYDDVTENQLTLGTTGKSVQTLVLQTLSGQTVHFALEFKNESGYLLQCQQGAILPNCKFYLAGELNPESEHATAPENINSVFSQDHKTTVTVRVESLKKAYNTVPDLHDPQLEIGIMAEMKWVPVTPQSMTLK